MAERRQKLRGTTLQLDQEFGLNGLLAVDTEKKHIRLYDGVVKGGYKILNEAQIAALYTLPTRLSEKGVSLSGASRSANEALLNGFYYTDSAVTDQPAAAAGVIFVQTGANGTIITQVWTRGSDGSTYERVRSAAGVWSAWVRMIDLTFLTGSSAAIAYNAARLDGQLPSFYTNIVARLGYTPLNKAGDTVTGDLATGGDVTVGGLLTSGGVGIAGSKIRLTNTSGVSLTSTNHAIQIGPDSGANLRMDPDEIAALNNGAFTVLYLNGQGGDVRLGSNTNGGTIQLRTTTQILGNTTITGNVDVTGGLISRGAGPYLKLIDTTSSELSAQMRVNANNIYMDSSSDDINFAEVFRFELDTKVGYVNGKRIRTEQDGRTISVADGGTGANNPTSARGLLGLGSIATLDTGDLVYSGTSASNTSFPITTHLFVDPGDPGAGPARGSAVNVYLSSANNYQFVTESAADRGSQLSGGWRARGWYNGNGRDLLIVERV